MKLSKEDESRDLSISDFQKALIVILQSLK